MHETNRTDDKTTNAYLALCRMLDQIGGIRYSTVLKFVTIDGEIHSSRVFSTVPEIYPTGATKPLWKGAWFDRLYLRKEVFVANGSQAIRDTFPDADVVAGLGATLQANIPVVADGVAVGLFNLSLGDGDDWEKLVPFLDDSAEVVLGLLTGMD